MTTRLESTPAQRAAAIVGRFPTSRDQILVAEPDHRWPSRFRELAVSLKRILGDTAVRIDHVGSTSVPGLAAKPIIDIDISVRDSEAEEDYAPALASAGYLMVIREPWWHGHRMFVDSAGSVNIHVWPVGAAEPIRHVLFRDWLRTHDDDRDRYAQIKNELAREFEAEPDRYNLAKNTVIDSIYARIFREHASAASGETGLKRHFGLNLAELLAQKLAATRPDFDCESFLSDVAGSDIRSRELLARVELLADLLRRHLPDAYPDALAALTGILGPENPNETGMFTFGHWLWPIGTFIGKYGLSEFKLSTTAIGELTKRHTGEYAIRPFLEQYPERTLRTMRLWADSQNVHQRRLSSEGLRPRLPWAKKLTVFLDDPSPVFAVLNALKDDTSRFVQKSVANNINDHLKDRRSDAIVLLTEWAEDATPQRRWVIRHALRNELKRSAADARAIVSW